MFKGGSIVQEDGNSVRRVVITGLGCVSPVGNDVHTAWNNLIAGKSGVGPVTLFDASEFETRIAGEVKEFDVDPYMDRKEARRHDRFVHFAMAATKQALDDAQVDMAAENPDRIGVIIGSAIGGIQTLLEQNERLQKRGPRRVSPFALPAMIIDTAGAQIAIEYGLHGPSFGVVSACATGTNAIGESFEIIRRGDADVVISGGTETGVIPLAFAGFNVMRAMSTRNDEPEKASRPFDADRDGFIISEGAAVLLLETLEHAQARGAKIYAEVIGYGSTVDGYHLAAPPEDGIGMQRTMRHAMEQAGVRPEEISYINAHGTSTPLNDVNETKAIKSVLGEPAYDVAVSSTKSMTGHMMGAAGAFEAFVCVKAIQTETVPPTINYETPDPECDLDYVPNEARRMPINVTMSNSMGLGGHNACLIFRRYD